jgi:hypothetical protein
MPFDSFLTKQQQSGGVKVAEKENGLTKKGKRKRHRTTEKKRATPITFGAVLLNLCGSLWPSSGLMS